MVLLKVFQRNLFYVTGQDGHTYRRTNTIKLKTEGVNICATKKKKKEKKHITKHKQ